MKCALCVYVCMCVSNSERLCLRLADFAMFSMLIVLGVEFTLFISALIISFVCVCVLSV